MCFFVFQNRFRPVLQLHYNNWPDQGIPETPGEIIYLYYKIRQLQLQYTNKQNTSPLLVHCSRGIGQTGTYIALHNLLQQSQQDDLVDVLKCVSTLREQRAQMVETTQQYR